MESDLQIFQFTDYRSWLAAAFASRIEKNPQLSVSSLAGKVGMSQSLLSLILRGKRKLTFQRAEALGTYLELLPREKTYLNLLIQLEQTREINSRNAIAKRLEEFAKGESSDLSLNFGDGIARVIYSNPEQIELAKQAMKTFADELEIILARGERSSFVNISMTIN